MENRLIFVSLTVFLGIAIHVVSTEITDIAVPCANSTACTDSRLPANAVCQSGFCICPDHQGVPKNCTTQNNFQPKSAGRNPLTNHSCKMTRDCELMNGYCDTTRSQCVCSDGYVMAGRSWKCLSIAHSMGSSCEDDQQCQAIMEHTMCNKDSQCVCSPGYHFSGNGTCWQTIGFGDKCSNDQQCSHVENAECDKQSLVCRCSNKSTLNSNGEKCLLVATKLLENCVEKAQCTKHLIDSDCIDKRCQCARNNHFDQSKSQCVSSRHLGESCSADNECFQDEEDGTSSLHSPPQRCYANMCICTENYKKDGDKCVSSGASSLYSALIPSVLSAVLLFSRS